MVWRWNPREEEEGVFIPNPPELSIGVCLRPGRVTWHGWLGHPITSRTVLGRPATHVG
jgi:hypothetical protein